MEERGCRWKPSEVYCLGVFTVMLSNEGGCKLSEGVVQRLASMQWIKINRKTHEIRVTNLGRREYEAFQRWLEAPEEDDDDDDGDITCEMLTK